MPIPFQKSPCKPPGDQIHGCNYLHWTWFPGALRGHFVPLWLLETTLFNLETKFSSGTDQQNGTIRFTTYFEKPQNKTIETNENLPNGYSTAWSVFICFTISPKGGTSAHQLKNLCRNVYVFDWTIFQVFKNGHVQLNLSPPLPCNGPTHPMCSEIPFQ
jgi:hypothetical protein